MTRRKNFKFHPNLKKLLIRIDREHLYTKFENLRHRIYELMYVADVLYPFVVKTFKEQNKECEKEISDVLNGEKPVFQMVNYGSPESITNFITNYYFLLRRIVELFLEIVNGISPYLKTKKGKKPGEVAKDFTKFIKGVSNGEYNDYDSGIIKFFKDNYDGFWRVRHLRNELKKDSRGQFIYFSEDDFQFKFSCKVDKVVKYIPDLKPDKNGILHIRLEFKPLLKEHTDFFIEAFEALVSNVAFELNQNLPASERL